MAMIRRMMVLMTVAVMCIMMTGCSSYKPGKVTDGVYNNSLFSITTPEGFACYSGKEVTKADKYLIVYGYSQQRGAGKSFKCEYAAETKTADILVASEDNISKCTAAEYGDVIAKQAADRIMGCTIEKNEDVTVNGVKFRMVRYTILGGDHQTYYITQSGDKLVYVYVSVMDGDITGAGEKAENCISSF